MKNWILIFAVLLNTTGVIAQEDQREKPSVDPQQTAANEKDHEFVRKAAEGGMAEVMLGELAQTKGNTREVKEFGKDMVTDHRQANEELQTLAQENGYPEIPRVPSPAAQRDYEKLMEKNDADFDNAFARQMVKDHERTIQLFRKEAENGKDEEIKNWALKTLPVLESHLERAKKLEETSKNNKKSR